MTTATPNHLLLAEAALATQPMIRARFEPKPPMNRLLDVIMSGGSTDDMTMAASRTIFSTDKFSRALCEAAETYPQTRQLATDYIAALLDGVLQSAASEVIMNAQRSARAAA